MRSPFTRPKLRKPSAILEAPPKPNHKENPLSASLKVCEGMLHPSASKGVNSSLQTIPSKTTCTKIETLTDATILQGKESTVPIGHLEETSPLPANDGDKSGAKTWSLLRRLKGKAATANASSNDVVGEDGENDGDIITPLAPLLEAQSSSSRWLPRRRSIQPPSQPPTTPLEKKTANAGSLLRIFKKDMTTSSGVDTIAPVGTISQQNAAPQRLIHQTSQRRLSSTKPLPLSDKKNNLNTRKSHVPAKKEETVNSSKVTAATRREKRGSLPSSLPFRRPGEKQGSKASALTSIIKGKLKVGGNAATVNAPTKHTPPPPHLALRRRTSQVLLPPAFATVTRGGSNVDSSLPTPKDIPALGSTGPTTALSPRHQKGGIPLVVRPRPLVKHSDSNSTSSDSSLSMLREQSISSDHAPVQAFPLHQTLKRKSDQQPLGHRTKRVTLQSIQSASPSGIHTWHPRDENRPIRSLKRSRIPTDMEDTCKRRRTGIPLCVA